MFMSNNSFINTVTLVSLIGHLIFPSKWIIAAILANFFTGNHFLKLLLLIPPCGSTKREAKHKQQTQLYRQTIQIFYVQK